MEKYNKMVIDWNGEYDENDKQIGKKLVKEILEYIASKIIEKTGYEKYTLKELEKIINYYEKKNKEKIIYIEDEFEVIELFDCFDEFIDKKIEIRCNLIKNGDVKIFKADFFEEKCENYEVYYKEDLVLSCIGCWGDNYDGLFSANFFEDFYLEDLKNIRKSLEEENKGESELDEYIEELEKESEEESEGDEDALASHSTSEE